MLMLFVVHIAAGTAALLAGYVALFAPKGDALHRRSGLAFVVTMLTMCAAGATLAIVRDSGVLVNVPAAVTTAYLVWTSLTTVRPRRSATRPVEPSAMVVMLVVALVTLAVGVHQLVTGERRYGIPVFPYFLFGLSGLVAVAGDVHVLRSGARVGRARLARHLWRMTFALFIAAMSFFLGQAKVIPKPIRVGPLLAIPPLTALVVMLWWLCRVKWRVGGRRWAVGRVTADGA